MWMFIISLTIPFLIWGPFFPDLIVSLSALVFLVYVVKKKEFYSVFQEHFDIHTSDIDQLNYVDPNVNYDEYCNYIKRVEHVKSSLTFFINLMKTNNCDIENITDLCILLENKLIEDKEYENIEQNEQFLHCIFF
jgi:hypothetical protein